MNNNAYNLKSNKNEIKINKMYHKLIAKNRNNWF